VQSKEVTKILEECKGDCRLQLFLKNESVICGKLLEHVNNYLLILLDSWSSDFEIVSIDEIQRIESQSN